MFALIIMVLFGLGVAVFATQNTNNVTMHVANYQMGGIPLYAVVVGSILLGIFISWLISIVNAIGTTIEMHGKNSALRASQGTIDHLEKRVHELEIENARLKGAEEEPIIVNETADSVERKPGFLHSLRHRFAA